jgi:hypothetical protein
LLSHGSTLSHQRFCDVLISSDSDSALRRRSRCLSLHHSHVGELYVSIAHMTVPGTHDQSTRTGQDTDQIRQDIPFRLLDQHLLEE